MVNRVSTFSYTNSMITENMRLQTKYADLNMQISSGLKTQTYKGISRDSQYLLATESSMDKLDAYNANGNTVLATVNIMYSTMGSIQDISNTMLGAITTSLGGDQVPPNVLISQAQNAMDELEALLNLRVGGRYAFSGSDIDTAPVDLTDPGWTPQTPPSVANTSYYQGNSTINSVRISETLTVSYGILADDTSFEQLFRAFNLVFNNAANPTALIEASGLIQSAVDDVANLQGILSSQSKTIEDQIDKNSTDKVYLKELASSIKEVDIPSASVQLSEVQSQLESAYSASVRIMNLSLVNYLN